MGHEGDGDHGPRLTRRAVLAAGGGVALTALLAACGAETGGGGTTSVITGDGGTATVQPSAGGDTADALALLDGAPTCTLTPEQTEGPYYFDVDSIRSDVRDGRPGTELRLAMRVQDVTACAAGGAAVPMGEVVAEIWHCDAGGVYSGFEEQSGQAGGDTSDLEGTDGRFLRGAQVADADGVVRFTTVYPGWYRGRTAHIHLKVHVDRRTVLTSQVYFDDALSDAVYAGADYAGRGTRETTNANDGIFDAAAVLATGRDGDAVVAAINLGVDAAS